MKINLLNNLKPLINLSKIVSFAKGIEIGSKNYSSSLKPGLVRYIRVGDLKVLSPTYVDFNLCKDIVLPNDILIAFDGAPGRNNIGLNGSYSSGLYKIQCLDKYKGLVYFELNSKLNQNIIKDYSQGTTILHASKAIPYLQVCECNKEMDYFEKLFVEIVDKKKKIELLQKEKQLLLHKYFMAGVK